MPAIKHFVPVALASTLLALAGFAAPQTSRADFNGFFGFRSRPPSEVFVDLHSTGPQPITHGLAFRVEEASVKDRQLWVIGEVVNQSSSTYTQVRLVVGIKDGADLRLTLGKLVPRASRRVQARLATEYEHAPGELVVRVVEAKTDFRPQPYRW